MRNGGGEGKEDVILMFNKLILLKEVLFFTPAILGIISLLTPTGDKIIFHINDRKGKVSRG